MNEAIRFGGKSGIIWIFVIPVVFISMIHDSYNNFLSDSWFTKLFDDLFIKWISQRLLCLVFRSFFGVQPSVFIQNYIDFSTTVSLYHNSLVQIWSFLLLNIKLQRHWRNKRTIIPTSFVTMIHDWWFRFHPELRLSTKWCSQFSESTAKQIRISPLYMKDPRSEGRTNDLWLNYIEIHRTIALKYFQRITIVSRVFKWMEFREANNRHKSQQ